MTAAVPKLLTTALLIKAKFLSLAYARKMQVHVWAASAEAPPATSVCVRDCWLLFEITDDGSLWLLSGVGRALVPLPVEQHLLLLPLAYALLPWVEGSGFAHGRRGLSVNPVTSTAGSPSQPAPGKPPTPPVSFPVCRHAESSAWRSFTGRRFGACR